MEAVSERDLILNIVNHIKRIHTPVIKPKIAEKLKQIEACNLTSATKKEINDIWGANIISLVCVECNKPTDYAIKLAWGIYCLKCLCKGKRLITDKVHEEFIKEQTSD